MCRLFVSVAGVGRNFFSVVGVERHFFSRGKDAVEFCLFCVGTKELLCLGDSSFCNRIASIFSFELVDIFKLQESLQTTSISPLPFSVMEPTTLSLIAISVLFSVVVGLSSVLNSFQGLRLSKEQ